MSAYRIQVSPYAPAGTFCIVMPDYSHPETPYFNFGLSAAGRITAEPAEVPDGRIIVCHPSDEQALRDAMAVAQETPKWWLDQQRFERALQAAIKARES